MREKIQKSAWQVDCEKQLTDMACEIMALREENDELRRMIAKCTLKIIDVKDSG